jgi:hypothetical protein
MREVSLCDIGQNEEADACRFKLKFTNHYYACDYFNEHQESFSRR